MRRSNLFFVVGLTALAVLGVAALDGALKLTGNVGDTRTYKLVADFTTGTGDQKMNAKVNADVTRKVIKVDSDGTITLQDSQVPHEHRREWGPNDAAGRRLPSSC